MMMRFLCVFVIGILPVLGLSQSTYSFNNPELPIEERVQDLVDRLTVEEKVSLLISTAKAIPRLDIEKYYLRYFHRP